MTSDSIQGCIIYTLDIYPGALYLGKLSNVFRQILLETGLFGDTALHLK